MLNTVNRSSKGENEEKSIRFVHMESFGNFWQDHCCGVLEIEVRMEWVETEWI